MSAWRTPGMISSASVEWATPRGLFRALDEEFGFTLDVSPMDGRRIREDILDFDGDALGQRPWRGTVWMNPPYGRKVGNWVARAFRESRRGATVVCLLPARTDTSWWHDYCMKGEIRFLRGRLEFEGRKRSRCPFPSAIVIFHAKDESAA